VSKGVDTIRAAAASPRADNKVGRNINSEVIPSDPDKMGLREYHPETVAATRHFPIDVVIDPSGAGYVLQSSLTADVSTSKRALTVAKAPRNAPCPCGSGVKYKRCHGKR
jgi:hypothetical protein